MFLKLRFFKFLCVKMLKFECVGENFKCVRENIKFERSCKIFKLGKQFQKFKNSFK